MKEHYKAINWPFHVLIPSPARGSRDATWERKVIIQWLKMYNRKIILYQPSIDADIEIMGPDFAYNIERFKYPMRVHNRRRVVYFQIGKAPLEILVWELPKAFKGVLKRYRQK